MSGRAAPVLSVVVPAWNEVDRIQDCVDQLWARLGHLGPEIIVVDDGSSDGTAGACRAWIRGHPAAPVAVLALPHRGKGAAVRAGALASRGDVVAYIDADLDIPAAEVARLVRLRADLGLDVVVASKAPFRRRPAASPDRPFYRRALSLMVRWLVRALFRLPVRDTQTGLKLFSGPWLRAVAPHTRLSGFLFDLELLATASVDGLRMAEVPVSVGMRRAVSRLGPADLVGALRELLQMPGSLRRMRQALRRLPPGPRCAQATDQNRPETVRRPRAPAF